MSISKNALQHHLPSNLKTHLHGKTWHAVNVGESDAAVWRITDDTRTQYLKVTLATAQFPAQRDSQKLNWLAGKVPVPQVEYYGESSDYQFLLMSDIAGIFPFHDDLNWSPRERVTFLAEAAKQFHSIPIDDCPYDESIAAQLAQVERNIAAGRIRVDLWEDEHEGKSIAQLHAELLAARPPHEDSVIMHGDLYPVNIHANPNTKQLSGYLDVGGMGVGDPYKDLALCVQAIGWHYDPALIDHFFAVYGIPRNDANIRFFQLMSEFF